MTPVAICIFVKGLQDVHTTTAKICEKDPQTLAEVIRLVGKLNAAQQLTAMLTPSAVSVMSNDHRCFVVDEWVILPATVPVHSVMAVMNLATLHRTAPTRFLHKECHATKTDAVQGTDIPTPKGTDHIPLIMVQDMGGISAGHSPTTIPTTTGAAVSEGRHHAPYPTTAPADVIYTTILQTGTALTPATPTALHRNHNQEKPGHIQDLQPPHKLHCSKTVTIQDSPSDSSSHSDSDSDPSTYYSPLPLVMNMNREGILQTLTTP